jgi:hypothetical protein
MAVKFLLQSPLPCRGKSREIPRRNTPEKYRGDTREILRRNTAENYSSLNEYVLILLAGGADRRDRGLGRAEFAESGVERGRPEGPLLEESVAFFPER